MTRDEAKRLLELAELDDTLDKMLKYNHNIRVSPELPLGSVNKQPDFVIKAELFKPMLELYRIKIRDELKTLGYEE